jgi:hypothetical protein
MAKISTIIPDDDLVAIDEVASPNRTAFMLEATRQAAARIKRERLNIEIALCLAETAGDDMALLEEFAGAAADGCDERSSLQIQPRSFCRQRNSEAANVRCRHARSKWQFARDDRMQERKS